MRKHKLMQAGKKMLEHLHIKIITFKEKGAAGNDPPAENSGSSKSVDGKKLPKLELTTKLQKKLDTLRGKDPNIYPFW